MRKLKSQKQLIKIVDSLRKRGKKIVTCNGSFEVLHNGHLQKIKECHKQGDVLILCLNSDKSVRAYKGPGRPINKESIRVKNLAFLKEVDYLTVFDEINPKKILSKIKPDIHCVGSDWGKDCIEKEVVEQNCGKIYVAHWKKGFSTSSIIKDNPIRAVFLDRDGTININEPEYLYKIKDFKFMTGAISALKKLSKTDYKIIIITNQSGIGRGYFKEKDLFKLHDWMLEEFKKEKIRIDKIYYCPHAPEKNCPCRKPKTGMIVNAARDFGINLSKSWLVGDDERDAQMAKEANVKPILLGGKVKNLKEAIQIIIKS